MNLRLPLLRGIYAYGFEKPSAIQQRAIGPLLQGRDVIAQAQSGTGKTGAFLIGTLQRLDLGQRVCQILVLSPTRELALQTQEVASRLGSYLLSASPSRAASPETDSGICPLSHAFVGGTKVQDDLRRVRLHPPLLAVGTPGRVQDILKRKALPTSELKSFILDEADEMLGQGFYPKSRRSVTTFHERFRLDCSARRFRNRCWS